MNAEANTVIRYDAKLTDEEVEKLRLHYGKTGWQIARVETNVEYIRVSNSAYSIEGPAQTVIYLETSVHP